MRIIAKNIAKRYNRNVVFKDFSQTFEQGKTYAILGPNGSGKSTLLKTIASMIEPDNGSIDYHNSFTSQTVFQTLGYVAPYIDIPEEYTFKEIISFHSNFRKPELEADEIIERCELSRFANTPIKEFSSGMKQRVKLSLVLFFKNFLRIYDEPCSHLDQNGFSWFKQHVKAGAEHSIVIIGSNNPEEYASADLHIDIQTFK